MSENHAFTREEVFPSWFANRIQDYLSAAQMDLPLSLKSATVLQVVPDSALGIAAVNIEGRWRFITGAIERAHPGGAKGTYAVWAVAEDNSVNNTPAVFTDHTNYAFELRITSGAAPTGAGIAITTKIGEVDWSGTAIEALRQTRGSVSGARIAEGALSGSSHIEWKREASGAWVPNLKAGSVATADIADAAVTSPKLFPTAGVKGSSGAVGLNAAFQTIAGTELVITPTVASRLMVWPSYTMWNWGSEITTFISRYLVDGGVQGEGSFTVGPGVTSTTAGGLIIELTAAKHTIVMQARITTGVGTLQGAGFSYLLLH